MAPSSTPREYVGAISNGHAVRADGSLAGPLDVTVERNTATAVLLLGFGRAQPVDTTHSSWWREIVGKYLGAE
jgi:hypothetical protein